MQITKKSPVTGAENTREIPCTEEQLAAWKSGVLIQHAMPDVSAEDREFLISGCTPEDWAKLFPPGKEG